VDPIAHKVNKTEDKILIVCILGALKHSTLEYQVSLPSKKMWNKSWKVPIQKSEQRGNENLDIRISEAGNRRDMEKEKVPIYQNRKKEKVSDLDFELIRIAIEAITQGPNNSVINPKYQKTAFPHPAPAASSQMDYVKQLLYSVPILVSQLPYYHTYNIRKMDSAIPVAEE